MSSRSNLSVLFLGATGYIGGATLIEFISQYPGFTYTAIIRNPKDAKALEAVNVKVIIGSYDQLDLIEKTVAEYDITINAADADDLPLTKAVIAGLKARTNKGAARKPILIHTSGTGVLTEPETGAYEPSIKVINDNDPAAIKAIPEYRPHRLPDLEIINESNSGAIEAYIISLSTIYAKGKGPVRNISIQIPSVIRWAVKNKRAGQVGQGTNKWNSVHIDDIARLYAHVLDFALSGKNTEKGYSNFYFGSLGVFVWGEVIKFVAEDLFKRGLVDTDEVKSVAPGTPDFAIMTGSNSLSVSNRSFSIGWKPQEKPLFDVLKDDIDLTLSQL